MKENEAKLTKLKQLFARLPPSVPEGGRRDAIHQVLNNLHTANGWESFNSKFDTLFGTSTINEDGTLKNLTRGPKGAGLVMRALEHYLSQDGMPDIAWLKVDRLIDGCEATISLAQGKSCDNSAALPVVTETEVEAMAQVPKVPKTVKRKEPAAKRPPIVTALGSTNYLAIHDAQDLDIPLSPGKKKAAKNYKPRKGDSESDSEQDAEVRLAPDGREILDSDDSNDVSDYSNTQLSSKRKRSIDSASGSDSAAFSEHSDAEDNATDVAESTGNDSVVEIDKEQSKSGFKKGRPTKKQKKETSKRNLKAKRPRQSSKQSKTKKTPTSEPIDVDSIPDTDSDTPAMLPGKRGPKNKSLHHYYNPVPIKDKSKELRWSFTCRYCKTVRTVGRTEGVDDFDLERNVAGLANLASHISQKHRSRLTETTPTESPEEAATAEAGVTKASQAILKSFVERGKLNPRLEPTQNGFSRMVSVWILEDGLPFTASESPGLARIFKYVKVPYKLPSDTTVRAVLKDVYKELSNAVTSEVKKVSSKISFSSDAWTTKQMTFSFSGLFGHWITNDWNMKMRLLSFTALQPDDHKGFYGAISFAKNAAKRGALRKITHTMDGASSNDVQAQTTSTILQKKYSIHWAPSNGRIFCMAHGGHRTVQKFLQILDEADDPDIDDYFIHHRSQPIHFNAEEDPSVVEHEAETALASLEEEPETVEEWQEEALIFSADSLSPIKKLHLTCIKIVSTPGRRSVFRSLATKYCPKFKHLMPVRSVVTRWNSVLASIERGILLRPAITHWVRRHPDLEYLELSNTDWSFLEQITTVLSLFSGMTLQMSRSDTPTLPWVLPLYQHISKSLLSLAKPDEVPEYPIPKPGQPSRKALSPKVRNAVLGALVVWEKYRGYALTSHFPILATLCHPMFRIRWFENSASDLEAKARLLFETIFDSYQSDALTKEPAGQSSTSLSRSSSRSSLSSSFLDDVLGPLEDDGASVEALAESEIVRYFRGDGGLAEDPLEWWKTHAEKFPIISQMARDFLAIPGSSVSVERLFSSARHLCADARSSLQAATITEAMCSKQWMKEGVEDFILVKTKVN